MRKLVLSIAAFFCGLSAFAQLDSLSYMLPNFAQGVVVFSGNQFNRGLVNISPMDQQVYCIGSARDTLIVAGNENIVSVSAGGRTFVKWRNYFVETVVSSGDTGVGIFRVTSRVNNVKTGIYGTTDKLSSMDTYSHTRSSGTFRTNIIDDPRNYVYTETPCLCKDGKYYDVSKKELRTSVPLQERLHRVRLAFLQTEGLRRGCCNSFL